jgi:hypothetical protein
MKLMLFILLSLFLIVSSYNRILSNNNKLSISSLSSLTTSSLTVRTSLSSKLYHSSSLLTSSSLYKRIYNKRNVISSTSRLYSTELLKGEREKITFEKLESVNDKIAKYSITGTIASSEMNVYLEEYKEEMKRRKVVFPGFRAGKLPPYVMADVRKYIVCFGLETLLGEIGNLNSLRYCDKDGNDVPFGEDQYYEQIVVTDFKGHDFIKQRDSWREGTDFSFKLEFYAEQEKDESESSAPKVIDTEEVKSV